MRPPSLNDPALLMSIMALFSWFDGLDRRPCARDNKVQSAQAVRNGEQWRRTLATPEADLPSGAVAQILCKLPRIDPDKIARISKNRRPETGRIEFRGPPGAKTRQSITQ